MKRFVVFSILAVVVIAACAKAPATPAAGGPAEKITIGMANLSQCCAYFIGMNNAVISEASHYPNV